MCQFYYKFELCYFNNLIYKVYLYTYSTIESSRDKSLTIFWPNLNLISQTPQIDARYSMRRNNDHNYWSMMAATPLVTIIIVSLVVAICTMAESANASSARGGSEVPNYGKCMTVVAKSTTVLHWNAHSDD